MPNKDAHVFFGTAAGAGYSFYLSKDQENDNRLLESIGGGLGRYFGSRLPDILNPANHPGHRGFAHSYVTGTASAAGANEFASLWIRFFRDMADKLEKYREGQYLSNFDKNFCLI